MRAVRMLQAGFRQRTVGVALGVMSIVSRLSCLILEKRLMSYLLKKWRENIADKQRKGKIFCICNISLDKYKKKL